MPIYEYRCKQCGHTFDKLQKMSDDALTNCPECQEETLDKLVSAPSFQLKGQGWYATDFKDKGKSSKTESTSSDSKLDSKDSS